MHRMASDYPIHLKEFSGAILFDACDVEAIQKMDIRDDDTWVLSFPRSGTTFTQEIVYLLKTGLDFDTAKSVPLDTRFPFLDLHLPQTSNFRGLWFIEHQTGARLIKSHLHRHILPQSLFKSPCKKIYIMRNPKDVIVSQFFLTKSLMQVPPEYDLQAFIGDWLAEKTYSAPWWRHVKDYWELRNDPNMLMLKYESAVKDISTTIHLIAKHLNIEVTDENVNQISEHCSFDQMKSSSSVNAGWMDTSVVGMNKSYGGHIRRGVVGGWKDYLTDENSALVDALIKDKLQGTGLSFDFGI